LTEAGKKRYLTKYELFLAKGFEKRGLTKEQAEEAAIRRKKMLKRVGIAVGAVTTAAIVGYVAHNVSADFFDKTIKAGKTIQTLSFEKDRMDQGDSFFTAYKRGDKKRYIGLYGKDNNILSMNYRKKRDAITRVAKEDVKIASRKSSEKMFNKLLKEDKRFASDFSIFKRDVSPVAAFGSAKTDYDLFNQIGVLDNGNLSDKSSSLRKRFYEKARSSGYGGILDVNDARYNEFRTAAPAIIFDKEKFGDQKIRNLSEKELNRSQAYQILKTYAKRPAVVASLGVTAAGVASDIDEMKVRKTIRENKRNEQKTKEEKKTTNTIKNGNPKNVFIAWKKTKQIKEERNKKGGGTNAKPSK
jgi:hypothetical protein